MSAHMRQKVRRDAGVGDAGTQRKTEVESTYVFCLLFPFFSPRRRVSSVSASLSFRVDHDIVGLQRVAGGALQVSDGFIQICLRA